jgi:MipA family protein
MRLPTAFIAALLALPYLAHCETANAGEAQAEATRGIAVGGLVLVAPTYEGADSVRVIGVPIALPTGLGMGNRVQFEGIDDIRFRLIELGGFEAGGVAGYRFGRDESDDDALIGLGDVDGGLVAGAYIGYRAGSVLFDAAYGREVTGADTGGVLRLGIKSELAMSPSVRLTGRVGTTWADDEYHEAFFGVTAAQFAASGLTAFTPDAGFKDVHLALNGAFDLTDRWTLRAFGKVTQLIGDAADSPIVDSDLQLSGGAGVTYRFDW